MQSSNGYEIRTIAIDPERAALIQWAFQAYATQRVLAEQLLDELTQKGLRTIAGPNRPSRPLQRSYLAKLLKNRYYIGVVTFKDVEYEGAASPLASRRRCTTRSSWQLAATSCTARPASTSGGSSTASSSRSCSSANRTTAPT